MKVAILDDEVHCVEGLVLNLSQLFPTAEIVYKGTRPLEAIDALKKVKVDLLFLDVEMPGMTGFEFLEHMTPMNFDVIFTTAYSQYAIKAFKAKAVNYLLKPLDESELEEAVNRWCESRKREATSQNLEDLLEYLKKEGSLRNKIAVPVSDGYEFIEIDEILYCQSQNNYTFLFLKDNKKVILSKTLKEFELLLEKYYFLRIHKSFLINPNYIKKYNRNDGGYLIMTNGEAIPVSRNRKDLITRLFDAISKS